jgi:hypothetical protein
MPVVNGDKLDSWFKEIENTSKPKYFKRRGNKWAEHSRIVGLLKRAPKHFTITIKSHSAFKQAQTKHKYKKYSKKRKSKSKKKEKGVILEETFLGDMNIYETGWVTPGVYDIYISAKGFATYKIEKVKLIAKSDCWIDIEFGFKEYPVSH